MNLTIHLFPLQQTFRHNKVHLAIDLHSRKGPRQRSDHILQIYPTNENSFSSDCPFDVQFISDFIFLKHEQIVSFSFCS